MTSYEQRLINKEITNSYKFNYLVKSAQYLSDKIFKKLEFLLPTFKTEVLHLLNNVQLV